jgi:hypothetical protein
MKLNTAGVSTCRASPVWLLRIASAPVTVALHLLYGDIAEQFDVGSLLDPPGQVAGHVLVQVIAADQEQHQAGMFGEEDGGLPGGVAAAHNQHFGSLTQLCLGRGGRIVDALPLELLARLDAQAAVIDPRGDQQALRRDTLDAIDMHNGYGCSSSRRVTGVGTERPAPNLLAWRRARSAKSLSQ